MKFQKVMIAIDESPLATEVLEYGITLAKKLKSKIGVISVLDTGAIIGGEGGIPPKEILDFTKREKKSFMDNVIKDFSEVTLLTFIVEGTPVYNEILKASYEFKADIIIIGTHGRTGLKRFFMGSVAENLIRHSDIPVFVIPRKAIIK